MALKLTKWGTIGINWILVFFNNFPFSIFVRAFKPPKGTSWVFNRFYDKFSCIYVQPFGSSGLETKFFFFFQIFHNYAKTIYAMAIWPQKAQLDHKAQQCAKFTKWESNSFCTVVRNWKCDARRPIRLSACPCSYQPANSLISLPIRLSAPSPIRLAARPPDGQLFSH